MKYLFLATLFFSIGCKKHGVKQQPEIDIISEEPPIVMDIKPELPEGAVTADFFGNRDSIYAFVRKIDAINEVTFIGFENEQLPEINIPESIGAKLQILKLKNFNNDVLLVNAKLKDTNFNEYYLFVWNDSAWKQPVNRFDIHKSNMSDTLIPIQINPKDSTEFLRYYSVFDMDRSSSKKFSWLLQHETVKIERVP